MKETFVDQVYDTLQGVLIPEACIEGVENAFAEDCECTRLYAEMLEAYERLCDRLGVQDEDEDVEVIINSLMSINHVLAHKMYEYGAKFGNR